MIIDVWELNLLINFYFTGFPIRGLKQTVVWLNDWVTIPWVGLDMDGCKYLEGSCRKPAGDTLNFNYPVKILSFYPPVSYDCNFINRGVINLTGIILRSMIRSIMITILFQGLYPIRWQFEADNPNGGNPVQLGCILTKIRIVA